LLLGLLDRDKAFTVFVVLSDQGDVQDRFRARVATSVPHIGACARRPATPEFPRASRRYPATREIGRCCAGGRAYPLPFELDQLRRRLHWSEAVIRDVEHKSHLAIDRSDLLMPIVRTVTTFNMSERPTQISWSNPKLATVSP
jgi:hypothetical protein